MASSRGKTVLLVALLVGGSCGALAAPYLTGTDLEKSLIGKTLSSTTKRDIPYTITFTSAKVGTYSIWLSGVSGKRDDSDLDLSFTNESVCFQSAKYRFQECNKVIMDGGKYNFVDIKTGAINNVYNVVH